MLFTCLILKLLGLQINQKTPVREFFCFLYLRRVQIFCNVLYGTADFFAGVEDIFWVVDVFDLREDFCDLVTIKLSEEWRADNAVAVVRAHVAVALFHQLKGFAGEGDDISGECV